MPDPAPFDAVPFDPIDAVLVMIDVQHAIDDLAWGPRNNPNAETTMASLLAAWRNADLTVIHVRHDSAEPTSPYRPGQPGNTFKPEVAPVPGEAIIAKRTNSAFIGTDLHERLNGAGPVVFAGVITNNSVEATVRMAGNLGIDAHVVADATWTVDTTDRTGRVWPAEDVHQLSLANMDGEYATVIEAETLIEAVRGNVG